MKANQEDSHLQYLPPGNNWKAKSTVHHGISIIVYYGKRRYEMCSVFRRAEDNLIAQDKPGDVEETNFTNGERTSRSSPADPHPIFFLTRAPL